MPKQIKRYVFNVLFTNLKPADLFIKAMMLEMVSKILLPNYNDIDEF